MSNQSEHLDIIKHNYNTLVHLTNPNPAQFLDWCTTVIYYMALHYVHAYLATQNEHPTAHLQLQPTISKDPNLRPIYHKYRSLEDDSRDARYLGKNFSLYETRNGTLKWFKDIQTKICNLLRLSDKEPYKLYNHFK